jgi:hypothetical protein
MEIYWEENCLVVTIQRCHWRIESWARSVWLVWSGHFSTAISLACSASSIEQGSSPWEGNSSVQLASCWTLSSASWFQSVLSHQINSPATVLGDHDLYRPLTYTNIWIWCHFLLPGSFKELCTIPRPCVIFCNMLLFFTMRSYLLLLLTPN